MIRTALVVLLGALPVLPLAFFAGYAIIVGIEMLTEPHAGGFLLVFWGLAGLVGAAALWIAAFDARHVLVLIGLLIGCVAISPIAYWIPRSSDWNFFSVESYVLFGPVITACALVGESGYRIYVGSPDKRVSAARFLFALCVIAIALSALSIALIGHG